MTWVSERHLVSAISNGGGFGVLASGAMAPDLLCQEIQATQGMTSSPFGVNFITLHPQLMDLIDVAQQHKVSHVVLAGGIPSKEAIHKIKKFAKVMAFAPTVTLGKRLIKYGVDALIIEGHEAGGHVGPVSTSVLAQEILPHIREVPVFVAGGIGRGEAILSYLEMGAAGCQLGSRFVCSTECQAHAAFKKAFVQASSRDAVVSTSLDPRLPVIPVRALNNKGLQDFYETQRRCLKDIEAGKMTLEDAQLAIEHFWAGSLRRAVQEGDIEYGSVMAGQSVGAIKEEQPVQHIIESLVAEIIGALESRLAKAA
jgi:enoyl-[acyl-carrier protein] reductase II